MGSRRESTHTSVLPHAILTLLVRQQGTNIVQITLFPSSTFAHSFLTSAMATLPSSSLKAAQLAAVNRMLAFNEESAIYEGDNDYHLPPAGSSHNQWKILIYDATCRSIISPLLSVSQLRRRGVTLHLMINAEREPIPDVPAVYFVAPTKENLAIIAHDCAKGLYQRAHLNFVTKLDRSLMEDFAKLVVQSGSLETIGSVHDQYLDYVCMERSLFTLQKKNSYATYNGSGATDTSIEAAMSDIAYGLFSVVATLGYVPIIRCPKVRELGSELRHYYSKYELSMIQPTLQTLNLASIVHLFSIFVQ